MSEEKKCDCEFCKLNKQRKEALISNDIEVVRKTMSMFADLWLNVDEDNSYWSCIFDGSWPHADYILEKALEKAKKHPHRQLETD